VQGRLYCRIPTPPAWRSVDLPDSRAHRGAVGMASRRRRTLRPCDRRCQWQQPRPRTARRRGTASGL